MEDHNYFLTEEKAREREPSPATKQKHEEAKRNRDRKRQKTRVNIGVAFHKWKSLMREKCFQTDAELACFLLESYRRSIATQTPVKRKPCQVTAPASSIGASGGTESFRLFKRNGKIYSVYALKSDKADGFLSEWKAKIVKTIIKGEGGTPQRTSLQTDDTRRLSSVTPTPAAAASELLQRPGGPDPDNESLLRNCHPLC
ncbi:uncharacterized protein si:ch211-40k21.5 [Plectropomus leopardus]|uniref:uncharacterized protein si:ch211-40k21.5 n=1 Tax=Plectropomus leopardus TaxID=160734 RepID=UPI001C4DBEDC|nr:uncharacterized protein si:ch211-40k21.5 [Plectropomus leopardus]